MTSTATTAGARRRTLMNAEEIERAIARMAHQMVEPEEAQGGLILIGIRRGGESLARRLASKVGEISGVEPGLGFLNINLYRDDAVTHQQPESQIPTDLNGKTVIVIDDVLFTGRTIRSALDAVTDLGRPSAVRLCVMIDRGLRELPIQGDYVGRTVATGVSERVIVTLGDTPSSNDEVAIVADAT